MVSMEEKMQLVMEYKMQQIAEWREIALELCDLYTCDRCYDTVCCTVTPASLTDPELLRLSEHVGKSPEEFIAEYCDVSEVGWLYLKSPCPFLKKGIKNRRYPLCRVHEIRPLVCRRYPFDDLPGVVHSTDLCPMAARIRREVEDVQRRLTTGELVVEFMGEADDELEEKMKKLSKEVLASREVKERLEKIGVEMKGEFEDVIGEVTEKIVPNVSGKTSQGIKVHPGIFLILLQEKK